MHSVRCLIRDKARAAVWLEIEIGRDDAGKPFWRRTRASLIPFNQFTATKGSWTYATITDVDADHEEHTHGIEVESAFPDGFTLKDVPKGFYLLGCGQALGGDGYRDLDNTDVQYRMEFLCS